MKYDVKSKADIIIAIVFTIRLVLCIYMNEMDWFVWILVVFLPLIYIEILIDNNWIFRKLYKNYELVEREVDGDRVIIERWGNHQNIEVIRDET